MERLTTQQEATLVAINGFWASNAGKPGPQSIHFDSQTGEVSNFINFPNPEDVSNVEWGAQPSLGDPVQAIASLRNGNEDLDKYLSELGL